MAIGYIHPQDAANFRETPSCNGHSLAVVKMRGCKIQRLSSVFARAEKNAKLCDERKMFTLDCMYSFFWRVHVYVETVTSSHTYFSPDFLFERGCYEGGVGNLVHVPRFETIFRSL